MAIKKLTPKQKNSQTEYQDTQENMMAYYGDEELRKEFFAFMAAGMTYEEYTESLTLARKLAELGINPIEAMKALLKS